jgi:O-antigen/teichoic acid export membrane protein
LAIAAVKPFFTFWVGQEVAATSAPVAAVLIVGAWANSIALVPFTLLQGSGRPDVVAKIHLIELLPYWLLLMGCLAMFGVLGAAIAWSVRTTADCLLLCYRSRVGLTTLMPLALPFLLVLATLAALRLPGSLEWAFLAIAFSLAVIWSVLNLPEPMREQLNMIGAILRRRARQGGSAR